VAHISPAAAAFVSGDSRPPAVLLSKHPPCRCRTGRLCHSQSLNRSDSAAISRHKSAA